MNWMRVLAAFTLPAVIAVPLAIAFVRKREAMFGMVAGTVLFFTCALVFGGLEYVDAVREQLACSARPGDCRPNRPSDFVRTSAYPIIAMFQTMMLFLVGTSIESRLARMQYDRKWR